LPNRHLSTSRRPFLVRCRRWFWPLWAVAFSHLSVLANGSEPEKKQFDLRTASAEKALKRFSEESGIELVFPTEIVAGVSTNAVFGRMTATEALTRMLDGTILQAVRDQKTGVITIRHKPAPKIDQTANQQKKNLT
jgi:hypothetical protein